MSDAITRFAGRPELVQETYNAAKTHRAPGYEYTGVGQGFISGTPPLTNLIKLKKEPDFLGVVAQYNQQNPEDPVKFNKKDAEVLAKIIGGLSGDLLAGDIFPGTPKISEADLKLFARAHNIPLQP